MRIHALKSSGDLDFEFIGQLRRVIQTEKPDLLHIHSRRGDMLAALAGRLENLPMVHSRRVDNQPGKFDLRFLCVCLAPYAGKLVTNLIFLYN